MEKGDPDIALFQAMVKDRKGKSRIYGLQQEGCFMKTDQTPEIFVNIIFMIF